MDKVLVAVDDLGRVIGQKPEIARAYNVLADEFLPGQVISILSRLDASWVAVVADLEKEKSGVLLSEVGKSARGSLNFPVFAYLAVPGALNESVEQAQFLCGPDTSFEKMFFCKSSVTESSHSIGSILNVHALRSLSPVSQECTRGKFVYAQIFPLGQCLRDGVDYSQIGVEYVRHLSLFEKIVLSDAMDAVGVVVDDFKDRIEKLMQMAKISREMDVAPYVESLGPLLALLPPLVEGELSIVDDLWSNCLATIPRGLEAENRLSRALKDFFSELRALSLEKLSGLVLSLPTPVRRDRWLLEREAIVALARDLPRDVRTVGRNLGEVLSRDCRNVINILESPFTRRQLLASFVRFVWRNCTNFLTSSAPLMEVLEPLKKDLRHALQGIRGERIALILPRQCSSEKERRDLLTWFESCLGKPCDFVLTNETQAWLYVETAVDPYKEPHQIQALTTEEGDDKRELKNIAADSGEIAGPLPGSSNEPCVTCRSDSSNLVLKMQPVPEVDLEAGVSLPKICPQCQRLNGRDWWLCTQHGKLFVPVPIDKDRCPDCILRHHEDPIRYPLSSIGVRPGLAEPFLCLNCVEIQKERPWHEVFRVEKDLVPFYKNGVNGHDSAKFPELAAKYGLLDGYRCPGCATLLIPVHHRTMRVN